jgi:hypothetical protein
MDMSDGDTSDDSDSSEEKAAVVSKKPKPKTDTSERELFDSASDYRAYKSQVCKNTESMLTQGCHIFLGTTYQNGENIYKMALK